MILAKDSDAEDGFEKYTNVCTVYPQIKAGSI